MGKYDMRHKAKFLTCTDKKILSKNNDDTNQTFFLTKS